LMDILRKATYERLVCFDLTVHLHDRTSLHCEPDAVIHEPSGFLRDAKVSCHLVRTDSVLAIGNHPNAREPFIQTKRAILKNRPDLGRELASRMFFFALPHATRTDEPYAGASASRAMHSIRPTQANHKGMRYVGVSEMFDRFEKCLRFGFHDPNL